jgi:hypothetical protein
VGDCEQLSSLVSAADENGQNYCQALTGKILFSALYGTYAVALQTVKAVLKASRQSAPSESTKSSSTHKEGYKEIRRCKRHGTIEAAPTSKKTVPASEITPTEEVATRYFFTPLRTTMETDSTSAEASAPE